MTLISVPNETSIGVTPINVRHALAAGHRKAIQSEEIRRQFRLGASSTVQRALQLLRDRDLIDREADTYFFLEPLFGLWIQKNL